METDVATIGETMALLVPDPPVDPESASSFSRTLGGAESNVAITLARLGARASWHSALGEDAFGRYIADAVAAEGVQCRVRFDGTRQTGLYLKEIRDSATTVRYYRSGSAASRLTGDDAAGIVEAAPRLIHTTGITPCLSPQNEAVIGELWSGQHARALKSFDVNFRPALHTGRHAEVLRDLAQASDIVFCGLDEARELWGSASVEDVRELIGRPPALVVKQGAAGATVFSPEGVHTESARQVEAVEVVGAGDALAAGFLFGRLRGWGPVRSLRLGTELASRAVQVTGDLPAVESFPDLAEVTP